MKIFASGFQSVLDNAQDAGVAPAWFFRLTAKSLVDGSPTTFGFWSGDDNISIAVESPNGGTVTQTYTGNCSLNVDEITYAGDLTDNSIAISLSQINSQVQAVMRGYEVRFAYCEIHVTSWAGGILASVPQVVWVGIVDDAPISTPAAGGGGAINLSIRSELMNQLMMSNPAKSSNEHQKRRNPIDAFCKYAATVHTRKIQWWKD